MILIFLNATWLLRGINLVHLTSVIFGEIIGRAGYSEMIRNLKHIRQARLTEPV